MPPKLQRTIYTGTFLSTPSLDQLQILEFHAVGVNEDGIIRHISSLLDQSDENIYALAKTWGWGTKGYTLVKGGIEGNSWWFPGFVDTHIHASQYPNTGIIGKTTLLDWLSTYTFPLESSLSSLPKARLVYTACITRTLWHGTTTASYFATRHVDATNLLADICLEKGQRAFVGRVCMDSEMNPDYYHDSSPKQAISDTVSTIAHIDSIDPTHELITPIITPRFAPSCSSSLLSSLGALASLTNLPIQTHISENTSEIALVSTLFPDHDHYADVYEKNRLLTPKTVLAHAVHLSPSERALVKERESKISHCPVSNTSLSSGLCPVRELLDQGITVGLGTDASGGYSASILTAAREAGMVSRMVAHLTSEHSDDEAKAQVNEKDLPITEEAVADKEAAKYSTNYKDRKKLSVEECLYLATRGGAKCLGLEGKVGAFEVGMEWDAQLIELGNAADSGGDEGVEGGDQGLVELWGKETWGEKVAKWLFCGDDRNTKKVFVRGRLVHERR